MSRERRPNEEVGSHHTSIIRDTALNACSMCTSSRRLTFAVRDAPVGDLRRRIATVIRASLISGVQPAEASSERPWTSVTSGPAKPDAESSR